MKEINKNIKPPEEWMFQVEYDIETAEAMLKAKRYVYAIFMAHLSLEKAFKAVYANALKENPPRTHNLILLQERIENKLALGFSIEQDKFIEFINEKSVPSRYPDTLQKTLKEFNRSETEKLVSETKGIIKWLKRKLKK